MHGDGRKNFAVLGVGVLVEKLYFVHGDGWKILLYVDGLVVEELYLLHSDGWKNFAVYGD